MKGTDNPPTGGNKMGKPRMQENPDDAMMTGNSGGSRAAPAPRLSPHTSFHGLPSNTPNHVSGGHLPACSSVACQQAATF